MTIQIDDAGWGCLLGGTLIGAYHVETQVFRFAEIPVKQFQGAAFARKDYLTGAVTVAQGLFEALGVERDEPIQMCRGYVLDGRSRQSCWPDRPKPDDGCTHRSARE